MDALKGDIEAATSAYQDAVDCRLHLVGGLNSIDRYVLLVGAPFWGLNSSKHF